MKALRLVAPFALIAVLVTGCSGASGNPRLGGYEEEQPGYEDLFPDYEHVPAEEAELSSGRDWGSWQPEEQAQAWRCSLVPTYNDDWHDDVLCSNGTESHRPYLREWDGFIEEWEILESAAEYEAELNAGG